MPKKTGSRDLTVRVKTARGRKNSSTRWLQRQLNDPYVAQAKRDGYRSRAAYKLLELDETFHFLKPGMRVLDLGAAPGGWTQVAAQKVGDSGLVLGVDLLEIEPMAGAQFVQMDFNDDDAPERIVAFAMDSRFRGNDEGGRQADPLVTEHTDMQGVGLTAQAGRPEQEQFNIVLSDMAANATGHAPTDHLRIMHLCELAYHFATEILSPGGGFVCKVLRGGTENELLKDMKRRFATVKHAKPKASRQDSAESYVVALGFKG